MFKEKIKHLVRKACFAKANFFGPSAWGHIQEVVKFSKELAKKLKADEEICEISAWLHDYASIFKKEWYPDHHLHGKRLAGKVLKDLGYPKEKIKKVKHCIYAHRGSKKILRKTLEARIVASADSMSHFIELHRLFWLAYYRYNMDVEEGKRWLLAKLERSYKKLMPEAKEIIKEKYEAIKLLFEVQIR